MSRSTNRYQAAPRGYQMKSRLDVELDFITAVSGASPQLSVLTVWSPLAMLQSLPSCN